MKHLILKERLIRETQDAIQHFSTDDVAQALVATGLKALDLNVSPSFVGSAIPFGKMLSIRVYRKYNRPRGYRTLLRMAKLLSEEPNVMRVWRTPESIGFWYHSPHITMKFTDVYLNNYDYRFPAIPVENIEVLFEKEIIWKIQETNELRNQAANQRLLKEAEHS